MISTGSTLSTDRPFSGNACVVVHGAADIPTETRLALVRETSLSECAYIVPSDKADFGARYYLASREIKMAGHPTVATVTSLLLRGLISPPASFSLEVGAGVLPIEVSAEGDITMTQARPDFGAKQEPSEIAAITGLDPNDIVGTPQIVSTGTPFCIALLRDKDALGRVALQDAPLKAWREKTGILEPFLTTLGGVESGDTFSRLLLTPPEPPEDPFTGSATGCMAAYLYANGHIGAEFVAEQGHWMGRPGQAKVRLIGSPDDIEAVEVSGRGARLMSGTLHVD